MMPLPYSISLWDDGTLRLFDGAAHIWFQFRTLHLAITMNGVDLTIVIEEYREIVDTTLHIMVFPRSANILRGIALQALAVDVGKHVELSVSVTDGRCPHPLTIDFLVIFQRKGIIIEVEAVETI